MSEPLEAGTVRDTTPPGVKATVEYTFDELITHLHDHHGMNAEAQAEDELSNGTDAQVIAHIRAMSRDEAIARLPYHYFQGFDSPDSLASAHITHNHDHADNPGGGGLVHFHPGAWVATN